MYVQDSLDLFAKPDVQTGCYLGQMTNDLTHDGDIVSLYSARPKFYSISGKKLSDGREFNIFKVRGKMMNRCVEKCFDQSSFENLFLTESHSVKSPYQGLRRCVKTGKLTNQHCKKVVRVTSTKRISSLVRVLPYPTAIINGFERKICSNVLNHFFPQI